MIATSTAICSANLGNHADGQRGRGLNDEQKGSFALAASPGVPHAVLSDNFARDYGVLIKCVDRAEPVNHGDNQLAFRFVPIQ